MWNQQVLIFNCNKERGKKAHKCKCTCNCGFQGWRMFTDVKSKHWRQTKRCYCAAWGSIWNCRLSIFWYVISKVPGEENFGILKPLTDSLQSSPRWQIDKQNDKVTAKWRLHNTEDYVNAVRMRRDDEERGRESQTSKQNEVDGVNITVEAHWCLPKGGEQCDSTDVATGISEHHSASTGVLFSVSVLHRTRPCVVKSTLRLKTQSTATRGALTLKAEKKWT